MKETYTDNDYTKISACATIYYKMVIVGYILTLLLLVFGTWRLRLADLGSFE